MPIVTEVQPVWRLDQGIIGAYRLSRRMPTRPACLNEAEQEAVGHVMLDALLPILEQYRREGGVFALILPGLFANCSARRPRLKLIGRCTAFAAIMKKAVILEMEAPGTGAPTGRIGETAAMMKPFFHRLTLEVADAWQADVGMREHGFHVLSLDASRLPPGSTKMDMLVRTARRRTANVMVHGLASVEDPDRWRALGASHLTFRDAGVGPGLEPRPDASGRASSGAGALPATV
jgi:hypothetical protein